MGMPACILFSLKFLLNFILVLCVYMSAYVHSHVLQTLFLICIGNILKFCGLFYIAQLIHKEEYVCMHRFSVTQLKEKLCS